MRERNFWTFWIRWTNSGNRARSAETALRIWMVARVDYAREGGEDMEPAVDTRV